MSNGQESNARFAENQERDNSSERPLLGIGKMDGYTWDLENGWIYLGLGKWMDKFIWDAIQVKTPWKFLRDIVKVFSNRQVLANRCLNKKKKIISVFKIDRQENFSHPKNIK